MRLNKIYTQGFRCDEQEHLFDAPGVVFIGKNGAGKSSMIDAVHIALRGTDPDGNKTPSALMCNSNGKSMHICNVFNNDTGGSVTITRDYSGSIKKASLKSAVEPAGAKNKEADYWIKQNMKIPETMFDASFFFDKSEQEQRKAFLSMCDSGWTKEKLQAELSEHGIDQTVRQSPETEVLGMLKRGKECVLDLNAKNRSSKDSIKKSTGRLSELTVTGTVAEKKEKREKLYNQQRQNAATIVLVKAAMEKKSTETIEAELAENEANRSDAVKSVETAKKEKKELEAETEILVENNSLLISEIRKMMNSISEDKMELTKIEKLGSLVMGKTKAKVECSECFAPIDDAAIDRIKKNRFKAMLEKTKLKRSISLRENELIEKETVSDKLNKEIQSLYQKVADIKWNTKQLRDEVVRIGVSIGKLQCALVDSIKKTDELPDLESLESQEKALTDAVSTLNTEIEELQSKKEVMLSIDSEKADLEERGEALSVMEKKITALESILKQIISDSTENFLVPANDILNMCGLDPAQILLLDVDSGKECFRYGVERDGRFIPVKSLSTGERVIAKTAFIIAMIANVESNYRFLFIDDLHDLDIGNRALFISMIDVLLADGIIDNFIGCASLDQWEIESNHINTVHLET